MLCFNIYTPEISQHYDSDNMGIKEKWLNDNLGLISKDAPISIVFVGN